MTLRITQHLVGGFDKNCTYICMDTKADQAVIVDPTGDLQTVYDALPATTQVHAIWLTHTHFDHYDGIPEMLERYGALPIYVHELGVAALRRAGHENVHTLADGDTVKVGDYTWTLLHTPGHSPDSSCYYYVGDTEHPPTLLAGDTLFVHGCGRTTPQQASTLYESLQQLKNLPPETIVYPGHHYGPQSHSTIEAECAHNRFLRASTLEEFMTERFPDTV